MTNDGIIRYQAIGCLVRMGAQTLWTLDDLIQEGHICLDKAHKGWKPDGGAAFNTYFTRILMNRFANILRNKNRSISVSEIKQQPEDRRAHVWIDKGTYHVEIPLDLSPDAKLFLNLSINPPTPLRDTIRTSRGRLCHIVKRWLGWPNTKMHRIEREIRAAF